MTENAIKTKCSILLRVIVWQTTYKLNFGQVAFPPEVFLHVWSNCCEHVVAIHEYVDEAIRRTREVSYNI